MDIAITRLFSTAFWLQIFQSFIRTCQRFPLAVLSLAIINLVMLDQLHDIDLLTNQQSLNTLLFALAGSLWFTATTLLAERRNWNQVKYYLLSLPTFFLYCGYVTLYSHWHFNIAALILFAGLAITFFPWLFRREDNESVWFFNYQLLAALAFAILSAVILCGGISLILVSIGYLFELKIDSQTYGDAWLIVMSFLAPVYFLAHIPKQFDYQRSECQFPHGVVFILTYVLVPLALVYMVVLYAYFIKIMVQWTLPHGHLGTMISIFGVIGIITHLAIHPIHDRSNSILSWFYRHFYLIMIVPLALLAIAIGERIAQYGVTDFRYIVVACAIWFAILIISYLKNKQQFRLKHVTLSLALLSLLASFGPWGIHQLPINSQFSRLESVLIKNDLLINGKLNVVQQPDFEIQKSISSMVDYLVSHSAGHTLRPWIADKKAFDNELPYNSDRAHRRYNGQRIVDLMGIDYVDRWQYKDNHYSEISLKTVQNHLTRRAFSVSDYDLFIPLNWINSHDALSINATENNKHTGLTLALTAQGMLIVSNTQGQQLQFDLLAVAEQFSNNRSYQVEPDNADKLILEQSSNNIAGKLYIDRLQFQQKNGNRNIHILVGNLLLKIPE